MASVSIKEGEGSDLMARKKSFKSKENQDSLTSRPHSQSNSSLSGINGESSKKIFKCYRCGKIGHIKRFCRAKLQESNVADKIVEEKIGGSGLWQKQNMLMPWLLSTLKMTGWWILVVVII